MMSPLVVSRMPQSPPPTPTPLHHHPPSYPQLRQLHPREALRVGRARVLVRDMDLYLGAGLGNKELLEAQSALNSRLLCLDPNRDATRLVTDSVCDVFRSSAVCSDLFASRHFMSFGFNYSYLKGF